MTDHKRNRRQTRAASIIETVNGISDNELISELERRGNIVAMVTPEDIRSFYESDIFAPRVASETSLDTILQESIESMRPEIKRLLEKSLNDIINNMDPHIIIRKQIQRNRHENNEPDFPISS